MERKNLVVDFDDIIGHEDVISHLKNAIRLDKVSHAYLFAGEKGLGKKTIANLFAMNLQCEKHGLEPCGECISCRKALSKNHPDIIRVIPEKPNSISVDEIREQMVNDVAIKPYESKYKIYLITEAQKMTPQAQNALLKTLEEPPEYAVILLMADNAEALLPTITSRCVRLDVKPVEDILLKNYLMKSFDLSEYQAGIQAAFAQGNIGKARQIAGSEDFDETLSQAIYILRHSREMEVFELVDALRSMTTEKQNIYDYLELFQMWFRDVLMFKATADVDHLIFKMEINQIKERARVSSYEGLDRILESIRATEARLKANVNFELAVELLFLNMREY